jgi:hypothetical protein
MPRLASHLRPLAVVAVFVALTHGWQIDLKFASKPWVDLNQSSFVDGTYRITKPGRYRLTEDIWFGPHPENSESLALRSSAGATLL